eukprot:gnl/Dysnectes_brevis/312_a346_7160.p1 GENE.gnl/Dysnectes_brevis/312_a346_7160~~gnl/Dysnectes_brevis/312_a346_7160.p1  ORF type:complete len:195 (-),score=14.21 gnl/Dysnectes_brevis/312_a346_7160:39-584(-)
MSQSESSEPIVQKTVPAEPKPSTVVYVGHIPHGFYEHQMRGFFSQFGKIVNLRISRNKKTGKSKHYAFIEFESYKIAAKVASDMHGYLMFSHVLRVRQLNKSEVHHNIWRGANRQFKHVPTHHLHMKHHNAERDPDSTSKIVKRAKQRRKDKQARLDAMGLDYTIPAIKEIKKDTKEDTTK